MIPPSIIIRVEFERTDPVVFSDYLDEGDQLRMGAWLERRPELGELIRHALELAERERAA